MPLAALGGTDSSSVTTIPACLRLSPDNSMPTQNDLGQHLRLALDQSKNYAPSTRFIALDKIIACQQALTGTGNLPIPPKLRPIAYDEVVALSARGRAQKAIDLANKLAEQGPVPAYVLHAKADAQMQLEHPEQAQESYQAAQKKAMPGELDTVPAKEKLFFSFLDQANYEDAKKLLKELDSTPPWVRISAVPGTPNPDYTTVGKMQAQYYLYSGDMERGQSALNKLVQTAPMSDDIAGMQAQTYLMRGKPTKAADIYRYQLVQSPDNWSARAGLGEASLARRNYADAATIYKQVDHGLEDNSDVRQFLHDYHHYQQAELKVDANTSRGDGKISDYDWLVDSYLYSAPILQDWRLFAHSYAGQGKTSRGNQLRTRQGVGLEQRIPNWITSIEAHQSQGKRAKAGATPQISWIPNDNWQFSASYDSNSNNVPWKAYDENIQMRELNTTAVYQTDGDSTFQLGYQRQRYTDHNVSQTWQLSSLHPLWSRPRQALQGGVDLNAGHNRKHGTPYFSPSSSYQAGGTLLYQLTLWQNARRHLEQHVVLSGGEYGQRHYSASPYGELRLEQEWAFANDSLLTYGVGLSTHRYDKEREGRAQLFASLTLPLGASL